jgi:hypothetical protein
MAASSTPESGFDEFDDINDMIPQRVGAVKGGANSNQFGMERMRRLAI